MKFIVFVFPIFWLLLSGCSHPSKPTESSDVAKGFQIARQFAYYDWAIDPVERYFTAQELKWLETNKRSVENDIADFIGDYSTPAVLVAGYLKLESCLPILRVMLFSLRGPNGESGGDGADYTLEKTLLRNNMYPHHAMYINAIEDITGLPIHKAVIPTNEEMRQLLFYADKTSIGGAIDEAWCAKWLLLKLKLADDSE